MRPILLLTTAVVAVSARGSTSRTSRRAWNLPPPSTTSQESVAEFVRRVVPRGGDQAGYNDYYDDRGYSNNDDPYNQQYGNDDHYGDQQADDYQDDRRYDEDRYDDRRRGGDEVCERWSTDYCDILFLFWSVSYISYLFVSVVIVRLANLLFEYQILLKRATDELV
jgi:hypothetical protein